MFRAHWLRDTEDQERGLIAINIEHQEPLDLRIMRNLRTMPLSPHQREVCLLIGQGHSQDAISQRLHVKRATLKDDVRKIYERLDIHCREDLMQRVTAGAEPA